MKKAIITGATGEVGLALVRELIENDIEVLAVVRPSSMRAKRLAAFGDRVRVIEHALSEMETLPEHIAEAASENGCAAGEADAAGASQEKLPTFDTFYHLAWDYSRDHDNVDRQLANVSYTMDAIRAAKAIGCATFIGAGSQAEYGPTEEVISPDTPTRPVMAYGIAKLCAGQLGKKLASQLGIRFIWPRIISVYGPGDAESTMIISVIRQLLRGERPALSKGEQLWDFLYSADCARAMRLVGEKGRDGAVYCIGRGEMCPLREYIEALRDEIDPSLPLGFGEVAYREGQVMRLEVDTSSLTRDTGFVPLCGFSEGIRATIQWCRENEK